MEIRDNRQKEWFWLDNEYLNGYARFLGPVGTSVYISLCRHADNKTQTCFPSMELIAEENGIGSRNTVSKAIVQLEKWGIINIEKNYNKKTKQRENNVYTLLAKSEWKHKPCTNSEHGSHAQNNQEPCTNKAQSHAQELSSNNTHINNTQLTTQAKNKFSQRGADLIKLFEEVDPKNKTYYSNKTERASADFLISEYGLEQVEKVVAILPKTNKIKYMPSITKPSELKEKWGKLRDELEKKKLDYQQTKAKHKVAFTS